ncbi:MAG: hypothetical protein ABSB41_16195 [Anaerolineales bacterium]|jgi:esterase/lipase
MQMEIRAGLGSTEKEMMWVEGSGHVIAEEPQRMAVLAAPDNFIRRGSQGS